MWSLGPFPKHPPYTTRRLRLLREIGPRKQTHELLRRLVQAQPADALHGLDGLSPP